MYITLGTDQQARTLSNLLKDKTLNDIKLDAAVLGDGKRSRLIIRNLSFRCPAKHLTNIFSKFGQVIQVSIPKKKGSDTKAGFAFVQFLSQSEAEKAIEGLNGTMIDKRPIAVDWALPKDKYVKHIIQSQEKQAAVGIEEEASSEESSSSESGKEDNESSSDEESSDSEDSGSDSSSSADESEDSESDSEEEIGSFDVHKGATIFVRNLSFESSQMAVEELFTKWGTVEYVNIVRDFETNRPRGTAFVKFKDATVAEQCLAESYPKKTHPSRQGPSTTSLDGRSLILSIAVDRKKAKELTASEKKPKTKEDKRNLYLAYEGVITEQDEASNDMSKADLAKRQRALIEKKNKLQNPNFFVSKTRLSIRNIPKDYDDKDLRALFKKHSPPGATLKQVKIVRETNRTDSSTGKARSRGFGFVEFIDHSDALEALRALNNNPKIWKKQERPIVEFAVENAKALQKLHATMSRGKVNPKASEQKQSAYGENKRTRKTFKEGANAKSNATNDKSSTKKEKNASKPPKKKAKADASVQEKKERKPQRQPQNQRSPASTAKPRSRPAKRQEPKDSFDNIVDKYKRKFMGLAADSSKRNKKWYE